MKIGDVIGLVEEMEVIAKTEYGNSKTKIPEKRIAAIRFFIRPPGRLLCLWRNVLVLHSVGKRA